MLKITLVKSTIGAIPKHRKTVQALGLNKLHSTVEQQDNAAICLADLLWRSLIC